MFDRGGQGWWELCLRFPGLFLFDLIFLHDPRQVRMDFGNGDAAGALNDAGDHGRFSIPVVGSFDPTEAQAIPDLTGREFRVLHDVLRRETEASKQGAGEIFAFVEFDSARLGGADGASGVVWMM